MAFVVEQVVAGVTWLLRQEVLRPHQRVPEMDWPGDDDPDSAHFAAYDLDGDTHEVVGVATVLCVEPPAEAAGDVVPGSASWRLRGMATAPRVRGTGVGRALLDRVVEHVARAGGGLLWAKARLPAADFYVRAGFAVRGEPYEEPGIGLHVTVVRRVTPGERPVTGS